jgi:hypothetical protein
MLSPDQVNLMLNTATLGVLTLILMGIRSIADRCFDDQRAPDRDARMREGTDNAHAPVDQT